MLSIVLATSVAGLGAILVPLVIIVGMALLILWAVKQFLPELYEPARIIVGIIVLVAILIKLLPLLGF